MQSSSGFDDLSFWLAVPASGKFSEVYVSAYVIYCRIGRTDTNDVPSQVVL